MFIYLYLHKIQKFRFLFQRSCFTMITFRVTYFTLLCKFIQYFGTPTSGLPSISMKIPKANFPKFSVEGWIFKGSEISDVFFLCVPIFKIMTKKFVCIHSADHFSGQYLNHLEMFLLPFVTFQTRIDAFETILHNDKTQRKTTSNDLRRCKNFEVSRYGPNQHNKILERLKII